MSKRKPKKKPAAPAKVKRQKKPSARKPASKAGAGHPAISAETMDRLIEGAKYQQHPYGKVWQKFELGTFSELVANVDRRGLDQEILLYEGMVLEGWHRYLACLHTGKKPKFSPFKGTDLEAAERVNASGLRRQSTPEQIYASFLLLGEACPAFKKKYEELRQKGSQQKAAGKALSTDGQRVDVVKAKAKAAGVGRSTAAKVEKVKKENPKAIAKIASGATTANKELKKVKQGKGHDKPSGGSAVAEKLRRPPFGKMKHLTRILEKALPAFDGIDWCRAGVEEWVNAGNALSGAGDEIQRKIGQGFSSLRITVDVLTDRYGKNFLKVLDGHLEKLPKPRRGHMQEYRILKQLPPPDLRDEK